MASLMKGTTYNLYPTDPVTDLPTGAPGMQVVRFGLRWEPVNELRKGMAGRAERKIRELRGETDPADHDAAAVFFTQGDPKKVIGFGNMEPFKDEDTPAERASARHSGDSIRGESAGDDEVVELTLTDIPQRYDQIIFVGGAFKVGSQVEAVRDVKATLYNQGAGGFEVVGEYEPSLLKEFRLVASACLTRVPSQKLWDLNVINEPFDCEPGNLSSMLRSAMNLTLPSVRR